MSTNLAINKFFCYNQNNSGGSFVIDRRLAHYVIIEAQSGDEADRIAESIGIYFDGCESGDDCPCCGDRWDRAYGPGDDSPNIYGEDPAKYDDIFAQKGKPYCHIYYLDGLIKTYKK